MVWLLTILSLACAMASVAIALIGDTGSWGRCLSLAQRKRAHAQLQRDVFALFLLVLVAIAMLLEGFTR